MGRIKSAQIKRTAKALLKEENAFEESFEVNKKLLGNHLPGKTIKNKTAGYISRLKRMEHEKKEALVTK